jgi:hypothetical protein
VPPIALEDEGPTAMLHVHCSCLAAPLGVHEDAREENWDIPCSTVPLDGYRTAPDPLDNCVVRLELGWVRLDEGARLK